MAACGDLDQKSQFTGTPEQEEIALPFFPTLQTGFCGNRGFLENTPDPCKKYFAPSKGSALRESLSEIPGQRAAGD